MFSLFSMFQMTLPVARSFKKHVFCLSDLFESQALFNFMAELCWANYISPSEHAIHQAILHLLDTAKACSFAGISEPATWFLDFKELYVVIALSVVIRSWNNYLNEMMNWKGTCCTIAWIIEPLDKLLEKSYSVKSEELLVHNVLISTSTLRMKLQAPKGT